MSASTAVLSVVLAALGVAAQGRAAPSSQSPAPPIRHVFVLLLENQSYSVTFGARSPAPYLARTLPARGALLTQYYAIGHASLDNYVALVSGQAANEATQLDCAVFSDFRPRAPTPDVQGQLPGVGCVY